MALKLNEWKATSATSTLPLHSFEVIVQPPAPVNGGEELLIRTEAAAMPGVAFMSVDNFSPHGSGKMYNIPYRYMPQEINMTHLVDQNALTYQLLVEWTQMVTDTTGFQRYGAKYMLGAEGYAVDMQINVYNRQGNKVKTIMLYEAFPLVVEPIQLNWNTTDEYARLGVQYRFTRFEVQ